MVNRERCSTTFAHPLHQDTTSKIPVVRTQCKLAVEGVQLHLHLSLLGPDVFALCVTSPTISNAR